MSYNPFELADSLMGRVVPKEIATDIIAISKSFDVDAQIVGRVETSKKKELSIISKKGTFHY